MAGGAINSAAQWSPAHLPTEPSLVCQFPHLVTIWLPHRQASSTDVTTSGKRGSSSENKKIFPRLPRSPWGNILYISLARIVPIPVSKPVTHKVNGNFTNGLVMLVALLGGRKRAVTALGQANKSVCYSFRFPPQSLIPSFSTSSHFIHCARINSNIFSSRQSSLTFFPSN